MLPVTAKLLTLQGEEYTKHDHEKILQRASKCKQGYDKTAKGLKPLDEGDTVKVKVKPYRLGDKKWSTCVKEISIGPVKSVPVVKKECMCHQVLQCLALYTAKVERQKKPSRYVEEC